jgi:hypothetical protein
MYAISSYHSISPNSMGLDMGDINFNALHSIHLEPFCRQHAGFTIITAEGDKECFHQFHNYSQAMSLTIACLEQKESFPCFMARVLTLKLTENVSFQ